MFAAAALLPSGAVATHGSRRPATTRLIRMLLVSSAVPTPAHHYRTSGQLGTAERPVPCAASFTWQRFRAHLGAATLWYYGTLFRGRCVPPRAALKLHPHIVPNFGPWRSLPVGHQAAFTADQRCASMMISRTALLHQRLESFARDCSDCPIDQAGQGGLRCSSAVSGGRWLPPPAPMPCCCAAARSIHPPVDHSNPGGA